jgi:hypothetical protein
VSEFRTQKEDVLEFLKKRDPSESNRYGAVGMKPKERK